MGGIDATSATVSNDDAVSTLSYLWNGTREAISGAKESPNATFTIPLKLSGACSGGGTRNYTGTLTGTASNGSGSATVNMTAALANCGYDQTSKITTITAASATITGTIAITNDAFGATTLTLTAPVVTVNGVDCTGGITMQLTASSPLAQPVATGTMCGRTGAIPVP